MKLMNRFAVWILALAFSLTVPISLYAYTDITKGVEFELKIRKLKDRVYVKVIANNSNHHETTFQIKSGEIEFRRADGLAQFVELTLANGRTVFVPPYGKTLVGWADASAGTMPVEIVEMTIRANLEVSSERGDLDGDHKLTQEDVTILVNTAHDLSACLTNGQCDGNAYSAESVRKADLNGNGSVDFADVIELRELVANCPDGANDLVKVEDKIEYRGLRD